MALESQSSISDEIMMDPKPSMNGIEMIARISVHNLETSPLPDQSGSYMWKLGELRVLTQQNT